MILQEYIGIKISSKNLQYYKNLGYKVKNKETVLVKNMVLIGIKIIKKIEKEMKF